MRPASSLPPFASKENPNASECMCRNVSSRSVIALWIVLNSDFEVHRAIRAASFYILKTN